MKYCWIGVKQQSLTHSINYNASCLLTQPPTYYSNVVESGVKHLNPTPWPSLLTFIHVY